MTLAVAYLLLEALRDAVKQYGGGERQGLEALEKYMTGVFGESWGTECAAGIDMVLKVLQASGELDFGNRRVDGGLDDTVTPCSARQNLSNDPAGRARRKEARGWTYQPSLPP